LAALQQGSKIFQNEDLHPSFRASLLVSRLYAAFVSKFGNANCAEIFGRAQKPRISLLCEGMARITSDLTMDLINNYSQENKSEIFF
jgi:hypothetical protein